MSLLNPYRRFEKRLRQQQITLADARPYTYNEINSEVIAAYSFANLVERTNDNTDKWIQDLWTCFQGSVPQGDKFTRSYCAVGAWTVVNDVHNVFGLKFRAAKPQLGSSRQFVSNAEAAGYTINTVPAAGAVFYRPSDHSGNDHMGIVMEYDPSSSFGWVLQTFEFNSSLDQNKGAAEGALVKTYTQEQINSYSNKTTRRGNRGWLFIHVEESAKGQTKMLCGTIPLACLGVEIELTSCGSSTTNTTTATTTGCVEDKPSGDGWERVDMTTTQGKTNWEFSQLGCWRRPNSPVPPPPARKPELPSDSQQKTCVTQYVEKPCNEASPFPKIRIPESVAAMPHYSVLLNKEARHQILYQDKLIFQVDTVGTDLVRVDNAQNSMGKKSRDKYGRLWDMTEVFPMLTDDYGNRIIITSDRTDLHNIISQLNLAGTKESTNLRYITFARTEIGRGWNYDSWEIANLLAPPSQGGSWGGHEGEYNSYWQWQHYNGEDYGAAKWKVLDDDWRNVKEGKRVYNIYAVCQAIEGLSARFNNNRPLSDDNGKPFTYWIQIVGEQSTGDWAKALQVVLGAGAMAIGIPPQITSAITGTLTKAFSGQPLGFNDLIQIANVALPAEFQQYSRAAESAYRAVTSGDVGAIASALQDTGSVLRGVMPDEMRWVDSQFSTAKLYANNVWREAVKVSGGSIEAAKRYFQNVATSVQSEVFRGLTTLPSYVETAMAEVITGDGLKSISQHKAFRNAFLITDSLQKNFLLPNATKIASMILQQQNRGIQLNDVSNAAMHSAWAAMATGKRFVDDTLDVLRFNALASHLEDHMRNKVIPSIPAALLDGKDKEKVICWAREVEICTKRNIIDWNTNRTDVFTGGNFDTTSVTANNTTTRTGTTTTPTIPRTGTTIPNAGLVDTNMTNVRANVTPNVTTPTVPKIALPDCITQDGKGGYIYCATARCTLLRQAATVPDKKTIGNESVTAANNATAKPDNPVSKPIGAFDTVLTSPKPTPTATGNQAIGNQNNIVKQNVTVTPLSPKTTIGNNPFVSKPQSSGGYDTVFSIGANSSPSPMNPYITTIGDGCTATYPAFLIGSQWWAKIGDTLVEIVDCCPRPQTAKQSESCCDDAQSALDAVKKLQELVARQAGGEKSNATDVTNLQRQIDDLKSSLQNIARNTDANVAKSTDLTPIQNQINQLRSMYQNISQPERYDDTVLRQRIDELARIVSGLPRNNADDTQRIIEQVNNNYATFVREVNNRLNEIANRPESKSEVTQLQQMLQREKDAVQSKLKELQTAQTTTVQTQQRSIQPVKQPRIVQTPVQEFDCPDCPAAYEVIKRVVYPSALRNRTIIQENDCITNDC